MQRRRLTPLLACALGAVVLAAAGCGSSDGARGSSASDARMAAATSTAAKQRSSHGFAAPVVLSPPEQAPPIRLRNQFGRPVSLASMRGKAVMITFVYAHCPDVCPLIMQALGSARHRLGAQASRMRIVAVSVDPRGDRPAFVRRFLAERGLLHSVDYLLGTRRQLTPVWREYHVASSPAKGSELVEHSAFIFGVDRRGVIRTLYPANPLDPKAIAHDARLLVRE